MIYINLTQGTTTKYISMGGIEKNNRFYDAGILSISPIIYTAKNGLARVEEGRATISRKTMAAFDLADRVFNIDLYHSTNDELFFTGRAIIIDIDTLSVTLKLKSVVNETNLLSSAPDLIDGNGTTITDRLYPRVFGTVRHAEPLLIDNTWKKFHAAYGTVSIMYDDGVSVSFTDNLDGTVSLINDPVGLVTADIAAAPDTFVNAVTTLAGLLGMTVNSTHANATLKINYFADTQKTVLEQIEAFCAYHEHIARVDSSTIYLYDKTSLTLTTIDKDGFGIILDSADIMFNDIVRSFETEWSTPVVLNNPQSVTRETKKAVVSTGYDTGSNKNIDVFDNDQTRIINALTTKKDEYLKTQVSVKMPDSVLNIDDLGKSLSIDTTETAEDTAIIGDFVINEITIDFENATTTAEGKGSLEFV